MSLTIPDKNVLWSAPNDPTYICIEVFKRPALPDVIRKHICSYIHEEEMKIVSEYLTRLSPLEKRATMIEPDTLMKYLDPSCQTTLHKSKALEITSRIYKKRCSLSIKSYGLIFPMHPEILGYMMEFVKDKVVLEIAGANGENAILLALAGARKVYMNDILATEVNKFKSMVASLPENVQRRLEAIEGDCFEILNKKRELSNHLDVIYVRNLLHFFTNRKQNDFFANMKKMLKPGGKVVCSVNGTYAYPSQKAVFNAHPNVTSFQATQVLLQDYESGSMPVASFAQLMTPCSDELVSTDFSQHYLYDRNAQTKHQWQVNKESYQKMDSSIRPKIREAVEKNKDAILPIKNGSVRVLSNYMRVYTPANLKKLFEDQGFNVELTFVVDQEGHLISDPDIDLYEAHSQIIGIIAHLPEKETNSLTIG